MRSAMRFWLIMFVSLILPNKRLKTESGELKIFIFPINIWGFFGHNKQRGEKA